MKKIVIVLMVVVLAASAFYAEREISSHRIDKEIIRIGKENNRLAEEKERYYEMARQDMRTVGIALDQYYLDVGRHPTNEQGLGALRNKPRFSPIPDGWQGPYISRELNERIGNLFYNEFGFGYSLGTKRFEQ